MNKSLTAIALLLALSACDTSLPAWLGGDEPQEAVLPGERISVLEYRNRLSPDLDLKEATIDLLPAEQNSDWTSETSAQKSGYENLSVQGMRQIESASIGEGMEWETVLLTQPVIADGVLYAMDAAGHITAHNAMNLSQIKWHSDAPVLEDEPEIGGGGLAYMNGVLYVTTGYGVMMAIVAEDGSLLWRQETDVPIRSAPIAEEGRVFALTIDNQLLAHDARTGKPLWSHRGIKESALYLGSVSPTIENGIVVAAYTSGELYALRADDGTPLWSDTLIVPRRTSASSIMTGIDATPIVKNGVVYGISNSGLMVANLLSNGRGLWDKEIAGYHTPWVSGEYIFTITADHELTAIRRRDGMVKWVTSLRQEEDGRDITPRLSGPAMVNDHILVLTDAGEMLLFDPKDGVLKQRLEIPEDVRVGPVIANGRLYLLSSDATLYAYQ